MKEKWLHIVSIFEMLNSAKNVNSKTAFGKCALQFGICDIGIFCALFALFESVDVVNPLSPFEYFFPNIMLHLNEWEKMELLFQILNGIFQLNTKKYKNAHSLAGYLPFPY